MLSWYRNLKTWMKLMLAFGTLASTVAAVGYLNFTSLAEANRTLDSLYENHLLGAIELGRIDEHLYNMSQIAIKATGGLDSNETLEEIRKESNLNADAINELITKFSTTTMNPEEIAGFNSFKEAWNRYVVARAEVLRLAIAGDADQAKNLRMGDGKETWTLSRDRLVTLIDLQAKAGNTLKEEADNKQKLLRMVNMATFGITCLMALILGISNAIIIGSPLNELASAAQQISEGNLKVSVKIRSKRDETGRLAESFSKMTEKLNTMIGNIRQTGQQVSSLSGKLDENGRVIMEGARIQSNTTESSSSSVLEMKSAIDEISRNLESLSHSSETTSSSILEMSASSQEVAQITTIMVTRVDESASSILEIITAVNEVGNTVESLSSSAAQTAAAAQKIKAYVQAVETNAKEAATLTQKVTTDAEQLGMASVEKTIQGMNLIKESVGKSVLLINKLGQRSEQIGKILTVIEQVTKQTNLLALNAAILASTAGEQGKSFNVVAQEIKHLADQTSLSTKEIAQLIKDVRAEVKEAIVSVQAGSDNVGAGIELSLEARKALKKILESAQQATIMSRNIEKSTMEQSQQVTQISESVEIINTKVQQISAAILQQKKGGALIQKATEDMRNSTRSVQRSIQEQSNGNTQIATAVENVNGRIKEIFRAVNEQKKGTEIFSGSMENIRKIAHTSQAQIEQMTEAVKMLSDQATGLKNEVNQFKI
ncbi:MAG TPA: methyl-accepting chemotaxis protein [Nitrospiria bacterium]|nr:methyl-accepting chemotaxis protein [Nitrospiria bacterium]